LFHFLAQVNDFRSNTWIVQSDEGSINFASYLRFFQVGELGVVCDGGSWVGGCE
jgi:hypothetical protein